MYLNVNRFMEVLLSVRREGSLVSGGIFGTSISNTRPIRLVTIFSGYSKWYCPEWMFRGEFFPTYSSGPGYAHSNNFK